MSSCCLICSSKAVLSRDFAGAAIMIVGTIGSFLSGVRDIDTDPHAHNEDLGALVVKGIASSLAGHVDTLAFARDVYRYHFNGYECLCLRCGAQFDQIS